MSKPSSKVERNEIKKYLEWAEKAKKSIACSYGERVRLSGSVVANPCTCPVCGINPDRFIDLIIAVKAETAREIFKAVRVEGRWQWQDTMQRMSSWEQSYFDYIYSEKYARKTKSLQNKPEQGKSNTSRRR